MPPLEKRSLKDYVTKMTECSFLMDSSVWVSYLLSEKQEILQIIENTPTFCTSLLTLFEVKRKFLREKYDLDKIETALSLIQHKGPLLPLTTEICQKAADFSTQHKLAAMDALIYATAQHHKLILVTGDNDFRNLKEVKIV